MCFPGPYSSRVELHAIWQKPTDALGGGSNLAKLPIRYYTHTNQPSLGHSIYMHTGMLKISESSTSCIYLIVERILVIQTQCKAIFYLT